jgi:homocysteine S-methyltransferase
MTRDTLPQLGDGIFLTDSGIETDLIENGGFDLPEFAAFVLLDDDRGQAALSAYFQRHADIAAQYGCGLILETPTWRASRDWGALIGYGPADLRRINVFAVDFLTRLQEEYPAVRIVVSGCVGPRADGYDPADAMTADEAESYHAEQIRTFASADVALVHAMTIAYVAEAAGIARAAASAGVRVAISFTTDHDGTLLDASSLADAVAVVDEATSRWPVYYGVNCTHPAYLSSALPEGPLGRRLRSIRANASVLGATEGVVGWAEPYDPAALADEYVRLRERHPGFCILGGCCGTDARHVRAVAAACLTGR